MIITLTTDFGTRDTFVAQMKGVILSHLSTPMIVDITHEIPAQNILVGALALETLVGLFPEGTIHVAVVDPGVGSTRRPIAIRTTRSILIGPDNGLFSCFLAKEPALHAVSLEHSAMHRSMVSPTFHGRDVFASVAGYLSAGMRLEEVGLKLDVAGLVKISIPSPKVNSGEIIGEILQVDHFGNLVTNVTLDDLQSLMSGKEFDVVQVEINSITIHGIHHTYSDVSVLDPVAYVGSTGRIEIAIRDGNAAGTWDVRKENPVVFKVRFRD